MKNYILHIGLPKTGTTTLQAHYFSSLDQSSICYNPPSIVGPLVEALKVLDFGMLREADIQLLNDVVKHQNSKIMQRNVLISLENLSQRLGRFDFVGRGDFLKSLFPTASVVLVLRCQPALLRSLYLQFLHQHYFLLPEEVFIPFAKRVFPETEQWKASMQIDVADWNYTKAIRHFRDCYGARFHVLFYENLSQNLMDLGRAVLARADCQVDDGVSPPLPRSNVSYDSVTTNLILSIVRRRLAFHGNRGFDSQHIHNLMEQANQARFAFDAAKVEDFLSSVGDRQLVSRGTLSWLDKRLLRLIKVDRRIRRGFKSLPYQLPESIRTYLDHEARVLNASLHEVVDKQTIPEQYL